MAEKFTSKDLWSQAPVALTSYDTMNDSLGMSEVAGDSEDLSPELRRVKMAAQNSKNPTKIIRQQG